MTNNNPFLNPEIEVRYGLKLRDLEVKEPKTQPTPPLIGSQPGPTGNGLVAKLNGNYVFTDILWQGRIIPAVELSGVLLDGGKSKTQSDWADFSKSNTEGWTVPDVELFYQLMRRLYEARNAAEKHVVEECTGMLRQEFDRHYLMTSTGVKYGRGLDAIVRRLGTFPGPQTSSAGLDVPEFTKDNDHWAYLVLSQKQSESQLGTIASLPANAKPVLERLLGKRYEQAGAVFQYCTSRMNGKLRETRLWTPTAKNRNAERVVALGVYYFERFYLYANDNIGIGRPALGVRAAKNFHRKQR
jgi:hypothetical protein